MSFKTTRIEDLTGGINNRDYPSEIDNKQFVELTNWNFEGNKLVTSKGVEQKQIETAPIQGIKIDSNDIWTVSNSELKKNGVGLDKGIGILVTTKVANFKPGVKFYITIEGDDYEISGLTVSDFITNLDSAVKANGLLTIPQDDLILIYKADGTTVTYSVTQNTAYIIYNFDNKIVTPYVFGTDYVYSVVLDGDTYEGIYTPSSPALNQGQIDIELIDELFALIPSSYDKEKVFLDTSFNIIENYEFYAGILINGATSISFSTQQAYNVVRINDYAVQPAGVGISLDGVIINGLLAYSILLWGADVQMLGTVEVDGNILNVNGTYNDSVFRSLIVGWLDGIGGYTWSGLSGSRFGFARKDGYPSYMIINILVNGTTQWNGNSQQLSPGVGLDGLINQLIYNNNALRDKFITEINNIGLYDARENRSTGTLGLHIRKLDLSDLNVNTGTPLTNSKHTRNTVNIRGNKYEDGGITVTELESGDGLDGPSNIVVGNLGTLTVDRTGGGAFYSYDGVNIKIGEEVIGIPTVGTIYNGKIVLGGYEGNDNILFSKTSSPLLPLNVILFDAYDAGGQSVSGGDKGTITGMTVSENGLYVFKDNSIWYTNSERDNPDSLSFNFIFRKITSSGAYSQETITEVEQDVFYLDWNNRSVRRLSYEQNLTTLRDTAISREIENLFKELPEEQKLATSSYEYPNYRLFLTDGTSPKVTFPNNEEYFTNNLCFTYNVYNKSWTVEEYGNVVVADKGYIALEDNRIYQLEKGNIEEEGNSLSKKYTEGDDFIKKKYKRIKILGRIIPEEGETKTFTLEILNDKQEIIKIETLSATEPTRISFDLHTYFLSEATQFRLKHSGKGKIELYDLFYEWKATKI